MSSHQSIEQAVGSASRALRIKHGVTLEQLAAAVVERGLRWNASRVSKWERGEIPATLAHIIVVAAALSESTAQRVTLPDLVPDGRLALTETTSTTSEYVRDVLSGSGVSLPKTPAIFDRGWTALEDRILRDHRAEGITRETILSTARALFDGRSPSEERDHRAGPGATPQKRGRIARGVVEELEAELRGG